MSQKTLRPLCGCVVLLERPWLRDEREVFLEGVCGVWGWVISGLFRYPPNQPAGRPVGLSIGHQILAREKCLGERVPMRRFKLIVWCLGLSIICHVGLSEQLFGLAPGAVQMLFPNGTVVPMGLPFPSTFVGGSVGIHGDVWCYNA